VEKPADATLTGAERPAGAAVTGAAPVTREQLAVDLLDCLLEGCQVIGFDWKYVYVNAAAAAQGRQSSAELTGRTMMDCYPGIDRTPMFELLKRCMQERRPLSMQNEFEFGDGSSGWFELRFEPVPLGVCILSSTSRKRSAPRPRSP